MKWWCHLEQLPGFDSEGLRKLPFGLAPKQQWDCKDPMVVCDALSSSRGKMPRSQTTVNETTIGFTCDNRMQSPLSVLIQEMLPVMLRFGCPVSAAPEPMCNKPAWRGLPYCSKLNDFQAFWEVDSSVWVSMEAISEALNTLFCKQL